MNHTVTKLVLASFLWSLSFALIKSSGIDADLLSAARLGLAALLFLPLLAANRHHQDRRSAMELCVIGAIQFGAMYVMIMRSYRYLEGHEVALLTITTPILVVLFGGIVERRLEARAVVASAVAVCAALALRWPLGAGWLGKDSALHGLLLVGGANAAWALGQLLYRRRAMGREEGSQAPVTEFGWLYLGAFAVAGPWALAHVEPQELQLSGAQWLKILYLGLVPSGLAFYLWNRGALGVSVGTLAVMNNLKVPLAVAVALAPPFNESFSTSRLGLSAALLVVALIIATGQGAHPPAHAD